MTFTRIAVVREYRSPGGDPAKGSVSFAPTVQMENGAETVVAAAEAFELDPAGNLRARVAANTDPDTTPEDVVYLVTEKIVGQPRRQYYVEIPHDASGGIVDLGALNVADVPPVVTFPVPGPAGADGADGADASAPSPALAKLVAPLAARRTAPRRVVFAGSSTTEGAGASAVANRYVNRLVACLQAAYPSGLGAESDVVISTSASFGALTSAVGVHGYNAGESGTTASTYLTEPEITAIGALAPCAVFHMIGSNDYQTGVPVATYRANVAAKIAALRAATSTPCVHVLVHTYARYDSFTPVATWAAYGAALAEIAAADPDNVAFVDISAPYAVLGVPGSDPLDLISSDLIHQNDAGHAFMAELICRELGIPGPRTASTVRTVTGRLTSDAFASNSADLVGRSSDAGLGGAAKTWVGDAGVLAVTSAKIVRGASNPAAWFVGQAAPHADHEVSLIVDALPGGAAVNLDIHRQAGVGAGVPDAYRVPIDTGGTIGLVKRVSGTVTTFASGIAVAVGDRVTLRYYRGTLELRRNGVIVATVVDATIPAAGWAGLAGTSTVTTTSFSGFTLDFVS